MEPLPKPKVSFEEYRSWPDDERWEIVDGHPFAMSGASVAHQEICSNFHFALRRHFADGPCKVYFAPLDVRLSEFDVMQPDLLVICKDSQLKGTHVDGAPALVIEVLSQSSVRHDRIRKFRLYASAGVKEYWILHPSPPMAEVHMLDGDGYRTHGIYSEQEILQSATFPDLTLDLNPLFPYVEVDEVREGRPSVGSYG
jgi:Uma2 family endonuclease